jgi:hypothetical protein
VWLVFCARWPSLVDDVLERALQEPGDPNCIRTVQTNTDQDQELERFVSELASEPLSARDLSETAVLARAAWISSLVRDQGARRAASERNEAPAAATAPSPCVRGDPADTSDGDRHSP